MANVIAVIWDFDRTLLNGYMQDPIFKHYGVDSQSFWREVNELPGRYLEEQGIRVNPDTIYLNHFINYAKNGIFRGLNNEMLKEFGKELVFYEGVPDIFARTKEFIESNTLYREYDIRLEHYIVSTGMSAVIKGSCVMKYVDGIWGCELIEAEYEGERIISEIGYTIDNTTKTRAIFEINKGVPKHPEIDVNAKMAESARRVRFENMIYIADGPSDIPAFSLINKNGGSTFAIYPRGNASAFRQVEGLRSDGRINMYGEADYREGTTASMWIMEKIRSCADRMVAAERKKLEANLSSVPRHLND